MTTNKTKNINFLFQDIEIMIEELRQENVTKMNDFVLICLKIFYLKNFKLIYKKRL